MDKIPKFGTTPSRKRFWDAVVDAVNASKKLEGRNVTVAEHPGKGTLINVADTSKRRPPPTGGGGGEVIGACCYDDGTCDDLTESDCDAAEGTWQGAGTSCADDPCPAAGACCQAPETCEDTSCSILTEDACNESGGIYAGDDTVCTECPPRSSITISFSGIEDCGCVGGVIPDVSDANTTFTLNYVDCPSSGTDVWASDSIPFSRTDCDGNPLSDGSMTAVFTCSPCNDNFGNPVIQLNADGVGWSFFISGAFPLTNGGTYSNLLTCAFGGHTHLGTATISW